MHRIVCFQKPEKRPHAWSLSQILIFRWKINYFSKTTLLQRVSFLTILIVSRFSSALYQVSFYGHEFLEKLPKAYSLLKLSHTIVNQYTTRRPLIIFMVMNFWRNYQMVYLPFKEITCFHLHWYRPKSIIRVEWTV